MGSPSPHNRARRAAFALTLGSLLFLVYLLTFLGVPRTDDERFIIDTTDSMAVRGSLQLNQTSYLRPIQTTDVEPAQPLLSVPLYWLAYHIPWVGNIHALMLFSPIVTALTGVLLFIYALTLGYTERTAVVGALLFGLATIAWPYTQTYFREPLTMLNLFAAAYLLERWRRAFAAGERRHWRYLGGGTLLVVLALLSKEAALLALPALALIAYPGTVAVRARRRQIIAALVALAAIAVVFVLGLTFFRVQLYAAVSRYAVLERALRLVEGLPQAWVGITGYLFSPGKGLWWYSPVLLLALGAPLALPRARWRESWLPLSLMLLFVVSYAGIRGAQWQGGTGWGARYMLPLVPFLMIAALPLIDRILQARTLWPKLALGLLALAGLALQVAGTTVDLFDYEQHMQQQTGLLPYDASLAWNVRWSQAVGTLLYVGQGKTAIRWLIPSPDWIALAAIAAGAVTLVAAIVWVSRRVALPRRAAQMLITGVPVIVAAITLLALWRAYGDPRYRGDDEALAALREHLYAHAKPDDTILLNSPAYVPHFMNYYKGTADWYSMPFAPGERYSPEQAPPVVSDSLNKLVGDHSAGTVDIFTEGRVFYNGQPLWLVTDQGPWLEWAVRPVEWYMAKRLYTVNATDFSPTVRLVEYLPLRAPTGGEQPRHPVDAQLGEAIRLVGFDLETTAGPDNAPASGFEELRPGALLGVSLLWEAVSYVDADYTVAVFVVGSDGLPVLQQDRAPQGGFAPTGAWQPGDRIRDNYGFVLPSDLPPGDYQLWVLAYTWPSLERLPVTGSDGAVAGDYVLLTTLSVR